MTPASPTVTLTVLKSTLKTHQFSEYARKKQSEESESNDKQAKEQDDNKNTIKD